MVSLVSLVASAFIGCIGFIWFHWFQWLHWWWILDVYLQGVNGKDKTSFLVDANWFENFLRLNLLTCLKSSTAIKNVQRNVLLKNQKTFSEHKLFPKWYILECIQPRRGLQKRIQRSSIEGMTHARISRYLTGFFKLINFRLKPTFLKPAWTDDILDICKYLEGERYGESPIPFHSPPKTCLPRTRSPRIQE